MRKVRTIGNGAQIVRRRRVALVAVGAVAIGCLCCFWSREDFLRLTIAQRVDDDLLGKVHVAKVVAGRGEAAEGGASPP